MRLIRRWRILALAAAALLVLLFLVPMRFVWDEENTAPLARHGVDPALAERIFTAEDRLLFVAEDDATRFIIERTVGGRVYRVVFAIAGPDLVYPITAFRIASRRRRTP